MENTKKCPACYTDIPSQAKRCPNCQSDLRNYLARHPVEITFLAFVVLIIVVVNILSSNSGEEPVVNKNTPSTSEVTVDEKDIVDVPGLIGKRIDEVVQVLGAADSTFEPTSQQQAFGVTDAEKTFSVGKTTLLITYNPTTRVVKEFFLPTNDPSGVTGNKALLLAFGNLQASSPDYRLEFVKAIANPAKFTGVVIRPN